MQRVHLVSLLIFLTCLSGCVSKEVVEENQVNRQYSFTAETLNSNTSIDVEFDLQERAQLNPIILFWVSTGCYGCHDWADKFRSAIENESLNVSSIVSVHRYADFESEEKLDDVYGTHNNSSHPSPWTVAIPTQNTPIFDFNTGTVVDNLSIYEAFNDPVTPTIQIVNRNGEIVWTSKEYWPSDDAMSEVLQALIDAS
tara:strand:+ start:13762 stop:14355 length:594 start_codon:yes stop_codon:yes gene_type:complete